MYLFWAGAMRYGWNEIDHSLYEALIVVNDDVDFYEDAVSNAINQYKELKNVKKIKVMGSIIISIKLRSHMEAGRLFASIKN